MGGEGKGASEGVREEGGREDRCEELKSRKAKSPGGADCRPGAFLARRARGGWSERYGGREMHQGAGGGSRTMWRLRHGGVRLRGSEREREGKCQ